MSGASSYPKIVVVVVVESDRARISAHGRLHLAAGRNQTSLTSNSASGGQWRWRGVACGGGAIGFLAASRAHRARVLVNARAGVVRLHVRGCAVQRGREGVSGEEDDGALGGRQEVLEVRVEVRASMVTRERRRRRGREGMMVVSCQVPEGFRSRRRVGVVFACGELLCKVSV